MKSIAFYIGILGISSALFTACDYVDMPIPAAEEKPALSTALALDSAEAAHDSIHGPVTPVQKVLLEDYTGHRCGNCPGAAIVARNQKAKYGDSLVVMAVHANFFAKFDKAPYTTNFTTPEGEAWFSYFKFQSNPNGMVNRVKVGSPSSAVQGIATWPTSIAAQMNQAPRAGMTITALYKPETRKLNIKVRSKYLTSLAGKYNLIVAITEDSIVDYQYNYGATSGGDPAYPVGDVKNYVHSHAMRRVLNGEKGTLNKENPKANDITGEYFATTLDPAWKEKKCSVVAFIYDVVTDAVVQVEEIHLH